MKNVYLLSIRTPRGPTPLAVFSTEEKALALARALVIDYVISEMPVDVWTVKDKEA